MFRTRSITGVPLYQSANANAEAVKEGFLVRHLEYDIIIYDLLHHGRRRSVQHYLLLGKRGSGKSTLLRRIQVEIDSNEQLSGYIAVNPAEEQANIYRLFDLLTEIVRELEHRQMEVEWPEETDPHGYAKALFAVIHRALEKTGKRLVLLLDNLDRIFESLDDELHLLRAHLQNFGDIKIIGGSTKLTEHFWAYDKPFYEFFRVMRLKPLDSAEMKGLLLHWAERQQIPRLKEFVENRPGQLEAIRTLTDGLPRTIQVFVQILIAENPDSGFEYLWGLMDEATPAYQERLNSLPPAQRKIILQLAFFWEAVGTKELASAARMETRIISAQLNQLVEKGVVEKIETDNKNHLYRLSERYFNLWLIFTQGSADERRKAKYLTNFLEDFYDKAGVIEFASEHLQAMKIGKVAPDKAILLTKALAQSKFITSGTRDELIKQTLLIPGVDEEMKREIPPTTLEVYSRVEKWMAGQHWQRAFEEVKAIEQTDGTGEFMTGIIYRESGDIKKQEEYYLEAANHGLRNALHDLLVLYLDQNRFEAAETLFWQAYEKRLPIVPESLMGFRRVFGDPIIQWEGGAYPFWYEYDLGTVAGALGKEYSGQEKFDLAEKYFKLAIELGNEQGLYNLGLLYYRHNMEKEIVLGLIKDYFEVVRSPGSIQYSFYVTIKAWAGDFAEMDQLIKRVIASDENVYAMLESLLVHHQTATVKQLFASGVAGKTLKEKYLPLYYATTLLTDHTIRAQKKIPPELKETVDGILREIHNKQKYYYPKA